MFNTDYLLAGKKTGSIKMGVSLAASWAWGVSIVVGMQIFQEKGLAAFAIWAVFNSLALLVFGTLALKAKNDDITLQSISGSKIVYWLGLVIQFFSILVNLTALKLAAGYIGIRQDLFMLIICAAVISYVWRGGLKASINTDLLQYGAWIILLGIALIGAKNGHVITSGLRDIGWAAWSVVLVLAAPFLDQQLWQRRFALKGETIKPFVLGSGLFAVYMVLVGLAAYYRIGGLLIGLTILMVGASTLDSAFIAVACYSERHGKLLFLVLAGLACLVLLLNIGMLEIWTTYATLRVPFAVYVVYKILKGGRHV